MEVVKCCDSALELLALRRRRAWVGVDPPTCEVNAETPTIAYVDENRIAVSLHKTYLLNIQCKKKIISYVRRSERGSNNLPLAHVSVGASALFVNCCSRQCFL